VQSIDLLMQEHRTIERVVGALELAAFHLARGVAVRPAFFSEAAGFFADYADGVHHAKEEGVLFGAIADSGMPADDGPIPMMLQEHVEARAFTRGLRDAARRLEGGDASAAPDVVAAARRYAALIRDHIAKEDEVLFPMAEGLLSPDTEAKVMAGFIRLERADAGDGKLAGLVALADRLVREAAAITAGTGTSTPPE
jgi:hemerythrin-like domain-containing protein